MAADPLPRSETVSLGTAGKPPWRALAKPVGSAAQRLAGHVVFWAAVVVFFTFFFGRESGNFGRSLLFVALLLPVAIATVYLLGDVLVPRYLLRRRYGRFALYTAYVVIISIHLELVVLMLSFIFSAEYRIEDMDPAALDLTGLIVGLYVVVFLGLCIRLVQRAYVLQASHAQVQQARLEAELKLREAELALLKAQIHPHFLFNTLNNLYGLTLERSESASDVVLGLSDLLDYVLYKGAADRVPLGQEVDFLQTYLSLERIRYNGRLEVSLEADGIDPELPIAPLLLVPLLENSFKHGARRDVRRSWIRMELKTDGSRLHVVIANGKPAAQDDKEPGADTTEGLGLENVRRRLELLYGGSHEFDIRDEADLFEVRVRIDLRENDVAMPSSR